MVLALALVGCTPDEPLSPTDLPTPGTPVDEDPIVDHDPAPRATLREVLATGVRAVAPVSDGLVVHAGERLIWAPAWGEPADMGAFTGSLGAAARLPGGDLLVERDGVLAVWDPVDGGIWRSSPLDGAIDGLERWLDLPGALWVEDASGLRRYDGSFASFALDGQPLRGPWSVGGQIFGTPAIWAGYGGQALGLTERASGWQVLDARDVDPFDLGVDGQGWGVVAGRDGLVHLRDPDGRWSRHAIGATAHRVFASPQGSGAWLRTAEAWFHVDGGAFSSVALEGTRPPLVDAVGRLVRVEDGELARWSVGRPVQVLGVAPEERVAELRTVRIAPTAPERVTGVEITASGAPLAVSGPPWSAPLDLLAAPPGAHPIEVRATYDDGEIAIASLRVWTGDLLAPTWAGDVQPLHQNRCAVCHNGGTVTLLDTRERWEAAMDEILVQVDMGAMPLAGSPLSAAEIAMVRAWRDGGFLP